MVLENLEPKNVFRFFEEMTRIPHGSGNMAAVSAWAADFAKKRSLKYRRDEMGNVVIWKPASPGYEDHPAVILQGHLDMVCVSDPGVAHDFARDPLTLTLDGDWLKAQGTTLGGDDGIAVACMMALLDDDSIPHPPLEAVFTVDEETGLLGAAGLDCSDLRGRMLINLDSEDEGVFTVGCAGGARCDMELNLPTGSAPGKVCTLSISGLPGGHSGVEIHKNIPNANRVLAQCLRELPDARLVSLYGGEQDNAIPNRSEAVFVLPEDQVDGASEKVRPFTQGAACSLTWAVRAPVDALSVEDTRRVLDTLLSAPNGVQAMEPELPGQVKTSLNMGILRLKDGALQITWSIRSSVGAEKEALARKLKSLADGCGASFGRRGDYPAWAYRPDSVLRDTMVRVYREQTGEAPEVVTIHAGLECGLFSEKMPGLDAVSTGPNMREIHTPRERLSVSSVQRMWKYLLAVLAEL